MKNITLLIFILLFSSFRLLAQTSPAPGRTAANTHNHTIAFGPLIPVGEFSQTHIAGLGIDHTWSRHRFGTDSITYKTFRLVVNTGVEYFLGKEIRTAGFDSRYGNYFSVYSMPGFVFQPAKKGLISLNAGPFLSIFRNNTSAGIGGRLLTQFLISKKIALGPSLIFKKRSETNTLWFAGFRVVYDF